jgi:hypothetical protein
MARGSGTRAGQPKRRITQPRRSFNAKSLAGLSRPERRKLAQVLLTEGGARVLDYNRSGTYDELVLETTPLWNPRRVRARIAIQPVKKRDIERLAERVLEAGDAEGVLLAPLGFDADSDDAPGILSFIGPDELIERLERSPMIAWLRRKPVPAYERLAVQRTLEQDASLLDPVGLRWLPVLALNELPLDLQDRDIAPQNGLERVAFRLMTAVFRFGGERYGEASPGQRLPDALLTFHSPEGKNVGILLDCKASAAGYLMDPDHQLRFEHYIANLQPELAKRDIDVRYLAVLSSSFQGRDGPRHPFHGRAKHLQEKFQVQLSYLRAVDVARLAVAVEASELPPASRETLNWATCLDKGIIAYPHLEAMLKGT